MHIRLIVHYRASAHDPLLSMNVLISIGNMYLTPNERAIYFYGGLMGAFLSSEKASSFDLNNHPWDELQEAMEWLYDNNPLFRTSFTLSNPRALPLPSNIDSGGTTPLTTVF